MRQSAMRTAVLLSCLLVHCGQAGLAPAPAEAAGGSATNGTGTTSTSDTNSTGGGSTSEVLPRPLVVMNWNVHDFVNSKNDSDVPNEAFQSASDYEKQKKAIAAAIAEQNPDIAILQEVENQSVLNDLQSELGGAYPEAVLIEGNDPRGIDVAALSKVPIESTKSHRDEYFTLKGTFGPNYAYARDCLELNVVFNGRELVFLGVHYRSKINGDDPDKRLAEAQHTRDIADAISRERPEAGILILGDMNDVPGSPPLVASVGSAPAQYADVPDQLPAEKRWSYTYNGARILLDHQMANPVLASMLAPSSVVISHDYSSASDHSPVLATYNVR